MAVGGSRVQVMRGLLIETALWAVVGLAGAIPVAMACLRIVSAIVWSRQLVRLRTASRPSRRRRRSDPVRRFRGYRSSRAGISERALRFAPGNRHAIEPASRIARCSGQPDRARPGGWHGGDRAFAKRARADGAHSPGFGGPAGARIVLPETRYVAEASQRDFFTRLLSVIRSRPEVRTVSASSYVPPTAALGNLRFTIEGRTTVSDAQSASPAAVDAAAFRALGIPLLHGRLFDDRDGPGAPDVCILSQALAHRYWGSDDPIGVRLQIAGLANPVTVIGVVGDVRQPIRPIPGPRRCCICPISRRLGRS